MNSHFTLSSKAKWYASYYKFDPRWEITSFESAIKSSNYGLSLNASQDGNIPMLRMSNIVDGKLIVDELIYVKLSHNQLCKYLLKNGDVLFNRTNGYDLVGKSAIFTGNTKTTYASYLVKLTIDDTKFVPEFVCYFLNHSISQVILKRLSTPGISQWNINPTSLKKNLPIPKPSLSEQRVIVDAIALWDRAIDQTSSLIEAKRLLKKALMQQLLSGKRRFREFKDTPWVERKMEFLFKERNEANRSDLPLLSVTAYAGVIDRDDLVKRDTSNADKSKYKRVAPGDIVYNTMRMWQGRAALSAKEGIVSPAYTVCIPQKGVDGRFMDHLFHFNNVIHLFHRYSQGLVDDTLSLKFPVFAKIKIAVPCLQEQQKIADVLDCATKEINLLEQELEALKKQKMGLMQVLLTGKKRVQALL